MQSFPFESKIIPLGQPSLLIQLLPSGPKICPKGQPSSATHDLLSRPIFWPSGHKSLGTQSFPFQLKTCPIGQSSFFMHLSPFWFNLNPYGHHIPSRHIFPSFDKQNPQGQLQRVFNDSAQKMSNEQAEITVKAVRNFIQNSLSLQYQNQNSRFQIQVKAKALNLFNYLSVQQLEISLTKQQLNQFFLQFSISIAEYFLKILQPTIIINLAEQNKQQKITYIISIVRMHKTFKILNQIISHYSVQPITTNSLDSYLTIQIIDQCMFDIRELGLTKGQFGMIKRIIKKVNSKKFNPLFQFSNNNSLIYQQQEQTDNIEINQQTKTQKQQQNKAQFTMFIIHEYNYQQKVNTNKNLCQKLMKNIDNLILLNLDGFAINNILFHDINKQKVNKIINFSNQQISKQMINYSKQRKKEYLIILSLNQTKKIQQSTNQNQKQKYMNSQYQLYSQICDIYHGHLNLRILSYSQNKSPIIQNKNTVQKLKYFINCIYQYSNSQDDLDVLLRQQIPTDAFIRIIQQRGNRISQKNLTNQNNFQIVKCKQNVSYTFKLVNKKKNYGVTDQLLIWIIVNNMPYLELLPILNQNNVKKRGKAGSKNQKYIQHRSNLGYTKVQMQERLVIKNKNAQTQKNSTQNQVNVAEVNESQCDSLNLCNSQYQQSQFSVKQQKQIEDQQPISTYIINIISKTHSQQTISLLIKQQMKQVLQIFLKQRKQIYQNLQINRNIMLIGKIRDILGVDEKDVYHLIYLNKL